MDFVDIQLVLTCYCSVTRFGHCDFISSYTLNVARNHETQQWDTQCIKKGLGLKLVYDKDVGTQEVI